jgi:hypothetical protein
LSGLITDSGQQRRLDKVQIKFDDYLQRLLSRRAATQEEMNKNPQLKPDVIESPALELTYSITGLHNSGEIWEAMPVDTGTSLSSGDCFKINFRTNGDCFIYVLLYGSGGIAQCLFPHEKIAIDNSVKGDLLYTVPDGENWYYLDNVPGDETIYIVACYEPMSNIAGLLAQMEQVGPGERRSISRDIRQEIGGIQTRGLESEKYVFSQRGVSAIAPKPTWSLAHKGKTIKTVTEVVKGIGSIVKVVSFEHR